MALLLSDAIRFIPSLNDFIFDYPLQLYSTGLIFAPKQSFVRNQFWHETPDEIINVEGIPAAWDTTLHLVPLLTWAKMMVFSPDGALLASIDNQGGLSIWDVASGIEMTRIEGPLGIDAAVFSPDSSTIAALDKRGTMHFRNAYSGLPMGFIKDCPNLLMTFNNYQNNKYVPTQKLSFPDDGRAWDVKGWRMVSIVPRSQREGMDAIIEEYLAKENDTNNWFQVFSDNGAIVASPTATGSIAVWDTHSGRLKAKFGTHQHLICGLLISPDAATIISNMAPHLGFLTGKFAWDIASGTIIADFAQYKDQFSSITMGERFLRHSNTICFPTVNGMALWDIGSKELTHAAYAQPGEAISFDDGLHAKMATNSLSMQIYRPNWKKTGSTSTTYEYLGQDRSKHSVHEFAISSKGLIALEFGESIEFRDLDTNRLLAKDDVKASHRPRAAEFSDNGEAVMYTRGSDTLVVRNTSDFSDIFTLNIHHVEPYSVTSHSSEALSADGKLLAVASNSNAALPVTLYDMESGMIEDTLEEIKATNGLVRFSPLSNALVYLEFLLAQPLGIWSATPSLIYFQWYEGSWRRRWRVPQQYPQCFTQDGCRLLTSWLDETSYEPRWEILSVADGSRLLRVTPVGYVWYLQNLQPLDWSQVTTEMLPTEAFKYLRTNDAYLDTETGQLHLEPLTMIPHVLEWFKYWLRYNHQPIAFYPAANRDKALSIGVWQNSAFLIYQGGLVRIDIAKPLK